MSRSFAIYDVFTATPLAGNPLAVVFDAEGLDTARMQAIAREFNLSETVFIESPADPRHRACFRIFTPHHELPFAGHPTVGGAIALAQRSGQDAALMSIEEKVGLVRCAVSRDAEGWFADFDLPRLPEQLPLEADSPALAAALGLEPQDLGFEGRKVELWSAGNPFVLVPVAGVEALGRVSFDSRRWREAAPKRDAGGFSAAYLYARQAKGARAAFRARMFVPENPSYEDPATGSAAAAFAGLLVGLDRQAQPRASRWIEQGVEMGRHSMIRLETEIAEGRLTAARIGGHAVRIAEGTLLA